MSLVIKKVSKEYLVKLINRISSGEIQEIVFIIYNNGYIKYNPIWVRVNKEKPFIYKKEDDKWIYFYLVGTEFIKEYSPYSIPMRIKDYDNKWYAEIIYQYDTSS